MNRQSGVTFFTAIKNRSQHLARTLPINLNQNVCPDTRFVIVDFGSDDGLGDWIHNNFPIQIHNGTIKYFSEKSETFHRAQSKNKAANLCETEIICNLDADNYAGLHFDEFLSHRLHEQPKCVVTGLGNKYQIKDVFGKIAVNKTIFQESNGFDERFDGYGYEDYDLYYRLEDLGCKMIVIDKNEYLEYLDHDDYQRICNQRSYVNLLSVYTYEVDKLRTAYLFLFENKNFEYGLVFRDAVPMEDELDGAIPYWQYQLAGNEFQKGLWENQNGKFLLNFKDYKALLNIDADMNQLTGANHRFKKIEDTAMITKSIMIHSQLKNKQLLALKLKQRTLNK